jgi:hypothetical protein
METYGFHFRYRLCGQPPTIAEFTFDDTETFRIGDLLLVDTGCIDIAVTSSDKFLGAAVELVSGTADVTTIKVITDEDAVYAVHDNNARTIGTQLDIAGTTGAMTVTTDANHDVTVVANSTATEPTLVRITPGLHVFNNVES